MSSETSEVLGVFPLTGTFLLPATFLPLNVFEQRYCNLVEDALAADAGFGMIQPRVPAPDNWGLADTSAARPELYAVGCLGRMVKAERQPDGRYLVVLQGVGRFRVLEEAEEARGYRRVVADLEEFAADREEPEVGLDPGSLLDHVESFRRRHELEFDMDLLGSLPGVTLLNALCVSLPFAPVEKQALLEAATPAEREGLLIELMRLGLDAPPDPWEPPVVH